MQRGTFALIDLGFLDGSPRGTRTKPVPKARSLGERFTESAEHRTADCLLLAGRTHAGHPIQLFVRASSEHLLCNCSP
jgi:hypothetical protein